MAWAGFGAPLPLSVETLLALLVLYLLFERCGLFDRSDVLRRRRRRRRWWRGWWKGRGYGR